MNASEVLNHPQRWKPVSREMALRECAFRNVVVVSKAQGLTAASPFNRSCRYYQAGTQSLSGLRYFLRIEAPQSSASKPGGTGKTKSPPPKTAGSDAAPEAAPEPEKVPPRLRLTKLDCEWFAPLMDTALIHYEITGDLDQAEAVHLRIASEKKPDKYILEKKLDGKPQAKGMFMWDGSVTDKDYAGCVNLIGSPYWVQLGLAVKGAAPQYVNKVEIRVELMQTELIVGDPSGLGEDERNANAVAKLKEELKKTPGKGRIHMPGSFFKMENSDMYDGTAHFEYWQRLGNGVPIPLFVFLWLKGKNGGRARSPQAVAGTPILWDTLPEDEASLDANLSDRGVHPAAKAFIKKAILYKKDATEPPGATCNWELGGIRSDEGARKYRIQFQPMLSDWQSDPPKSRKWAGLSKCGKAGTSTADSGMLYLNGRIAGDRYYIAAYADLDSTLDKMAPGIGGDLDAPRKSKSISLQNWRDVKLAKAYKIGASTASLSFGNTNTEFKKAALSVTSDPALATEEIKDRWKSAYLEVIKILSGNDFYRNACLQDPGDYPTAFASYESFWANSNPDAGFFGKVRHRIKSFFNGSDEKGYIEKCSDRAYGIYSEVAKAFPLGENGLTYFKFANDGEHNLVKGSYTAGIAPSILGYTSRNKAVLFIFSAGNADKTVIHEMGHNLFLPHAPGHWEPGKQPGGSEPKLHDKGQICLMSYSPDKEHLCGFCYLRMGGWDAGLIQTDGTITDSFTL